MHLLETELRPRTLLHRASPRLKLAFALVIITGTALLPRRLTPLYLAPAVVLLLLWPFCRMPLRYLWRRLLVLECFVAGLALLSVLTPSAGPIVLSAVVKSNLCIFTMLMLTWTTPFLDILQEQGHIEGFFHEDIDASFQSQLGLIGPGGNDDDGNIRRRMSYGFAGEPAIILG